MTDKSSSAAPTKGGGDPRSGGDGKGDGAAKGSRTARRGPLRLRYLLGGVLLLGLGVIGAFVLGYLLVGIPSANAGAVAQNNVYLYADGSLLARDGAVNRENIPLREVSPAARHAVLSAEDRDFYHESAVSPKAMVRAAWLTLTGKGRQSGSTITQQYVKNYYLTQQQTAIRKFKEFFIAIKLDREKSKDAILQGYLNTSYYGRDAYGIQAAAQAYFDKDAAALDPAEGAYLAALLNAPSAYDIGAHPENRQLAVARWNYVLDGMVKERWLSPARRAALVFPVPVRAQPINSLSGQRGYLVEAVKDYLVGSGALDEDTLRSGGFRITTTIDPAREDDLTAAARREFTDRLSGSRRADRLARAGAASIDPATGHVVALYGGADYTEQYVSNATSHGYQTGSTFKPYVLAAAIAHHSRTHDGHPITPGAHYDGTSKRKVQGPDGPIDYAPANEDDESYGDITVTHAMDKSVNAVFAQMAEDVGPRTVEDTAVALGLPATTPELHPDPSIALGVAHASVLEMASAYATLADHGRYVPYTLVTRVSRDGTGVPLPHRVPRQAIPRGAADTVTSVLRSVVDGGTASAARASGVPSAAKTGTAEDDKAAWCAGYTTRLATAVAVFGEDPANGHQKPLYGVGGLDRINGGGFPTQIWADYTGAALHGTYVPDFDLRIPRWVTDADKNAGKDQGSEHGRSDQQGGDQAGDDGQSPEPSPAGAPPDSPAPGAGAGAGPRPPGGQTGLFGANGPGGQTGLFGMRGPGGQTGPSGTGATPSASPAPRPATGQTGPSNPAPASPPLPAAPTANGQTGPSGQAPAAPPPPAAAPPTG
jgi:membrane peptidoglycan carboxypeptidase